MAGRYLVTGAQLGLIKGYAEVGKIRDLNELIADIVEKQFVGNTNNPVEKDVQKYLIENIGTNPDLHFKKVKK